MKTRNLLFIGAVLLLVLGGCKSQGSNQNVSVEVKFFIDSYTPEEKAQILTQSGIDQYRSLIERDGEIEKLPEVRMYFEMALRLDPLNNDAKKYLGLLEAIRTKTITANSSEATKLLAKATLKPEEEFALSVAVVKLLKMDPKGEDTLKLEKASAEIRSKTLAFYLQKMRDGLDALPNTKAADKKETLLLETWSNGSRVLALSPNDTAVKANIEKLDTEISAHIKTRLEGLKALVDSSKFSAAKTLVDSVASFSKKAGGRADAEARQALYTVSYAWAKFLYDSKDLPAAETRLSQALAARRTTEALNLQKLIQDQKDAIAQSTGYETALATIDRLLLAGDLIAANQTIASTQKTVEKDAAKVEQLTNRKKKIIQALPDVYNKGVTAYKAELFGEAVDAFTLVNAIDPSYQQVADYLDKAKAKKALLEKY